MTRQTVPDQPKKPKDGSNYWKPTPADAKREGEYLRCEPVKAGKEKFGETYIILDPTGQEISLPNHTVLQGKMKTLKIGEYVWISFIGKDNKTLLYNVEHDPEYKSQTKLTDPTAGNSAQIEKMRKLKEELIRVAKLWPDGIIPEAGIKHEIERLYSPGEQTEEMFRLLKFEGWLTYAGNGLKVIP